MNLKPSPLTEASAVLAIAILGVLLTFALSSSNIEVGFVMLSNSAITFLLPAFTFWAVIGLFVRGKSNKEVAEMLALTEQQVANAKFDFLARLRGGVRKQGLSQEIFPELYTNENDRR